MTPEREREIREWLAADQLSWNAKAATTDLLAALAHERADHAATREKLGRTVRDVIYELDQTRQYLYEARNPMLPNGETITVEEMYTSWQKEIVAHAATRGLLKMAENNMSIEHEALEMTGPDLARLARLESLLNDRERMGRLCYLAWFSNHPPKAWESISEFTRGEWRAVVGANLVEAIRAALNGENNIDQSR